MRTDDIRRLRFKEDVNIPEIETFAWLAQEGAYVSEYRTHSGSYTATGLTSEKLVDYMMCIPVPDDVEPIKREFMAELLINAVSRSLQQGNTDTARRYLSNKYYPYRSTQTHFDAVDSSLSRVRLLVTSCAQKFCAHLPASLGGALYRSLQRAKASFSL
jgi:hypothetical protein